MPFNYLQHKFAAPNFAAQFLPLKYYSFDACLDWDRACLQFRPLVKFVWVTYLGLRSVESLVLGRFDKVKFV